MRTERGLLLVDKKTADMVDEFVPTESAIKDLTALFTVFAKENRLKILSCLSLSKMCVTDLSRMLGMNQTTVSHELKVLRDFKLVRTVRQGKIIFYEVSSDVVGKVLLSGVEYLGY